MNSWLSPSRPSSQRLVSLPGGSSHSLLTAKVLHSPLPTSQAPPPLYLPCSPNQLLQQTFVPTVGRAPAKCWIGKVEGGLLRVSITDRRAEGNFNRRKEPERSSPCHSTFLYSETPHASVFTPFLTPSLACSGYSKTCTELNSRQLQ